MRYPNLDAEKARYGVTPEMIAQVIGRTKISVYKKLSRKLDWKIQEALAIKRAFFPNASLDYLFTPEE